MLVAGRVPRKGKNERLGLGGRDCWGQNVALDDRHREQKQAFLCQKFPVDQVPFSRCVGLDVGKGGWVGVNQYCLHLGLYVYL